MKITNSSLFKCNLKIESNSHKIQPHEGLSINELSDILTKLSKCITNKKSKLILTNIIFESYSPELSAEVEEVIFEVEDVHRQIATQDFFKLDAPLQNYAKSLKDNLFDRGLYLSYFDKKNTEPIVIKKIDATKKTPYSSITTINAKVTAVDGKGKKAFIIVEAITGKRVKLFIDSVQEAELFKYYKGLNVRLRVKLKAECDEDGQQQGRLLTYFVPEDKDFLTAIKDTNKNYPDIFSGITDSVKLLEELRNSPYE